MVGISGFIKNGKSERIAEKVKILCSNSVECFVHKRCKKDVQFYQNANLFQNFSLCFTIATIEKFSFLVPYTIFKLVLIEQLEGKEWEDGGITNHGKVLILSVCLHILQHPIVIVKGIYVEK